MFKKILIIGKGSSSLNHYKALKKIKIKAEITHVSSRDFAKIFGKNYFKLLKLNPDYFIICSPSIYHFKFIDLIEKNFTNKKILVEKPLFSKKEKGFKSLKNEYFIGYNLRHHPVLKYVKTYIKNKKIYFINNNCSTYLPNWRKKNYSKTVSAQRKLGGGVKLELSHELDYLIWIFGNFKVLYSFNKKVSNLKIDCDDLLCMNCITNNNNTLINLTINFFSRISRRDLFIEGKNFSIFADLLNNKVELREFGRKKVISFKNFNIEKSYMLENQEILNGKYKNNCTFEEAINLQKTINKIKTSV